MSTEQTLEKQVNKQKLWQVKADQFQNLNHKSTGSLISYSPTTNQKYFGSAVLISQDLILTAAHCVYDRKTKKAYYNFKFYLAARGSIYDNKGYYQVQKFFCMPEYKTCKQSDSSKYDFALMKLKPNAQLPIVFDQFLALQSVCGKCNKQEIKLSLFGYPAYFQSKQNYLPQDQEGNTFKVHQYGLTRKNIVRSIEPQKGILTYKMNTYGGQSGCPVVSNDRIIAIHIAGSPQGQDYNIARLVTSQMILHLKKWCTLMGGAPFAVQKHFSSPTCNKTVIAINHDETNQTFPFSNLKNRTVGKVLLEILPSPRFYYCLKFRGAILRPEDDFSKLQDEMQQEDQRVELQIFQDSLRFYLFTTIYNQYKTQSRNRFLTSQNQKQSTLQKWEKNQKQINDFLNKMEQLKTIEDAHSQKMFKQIVQIIKVCRNMRKSIGVANSVRPYLMQKAPIMNENCTINSFGKIWKMPQEDVQLIMQSGLLEIKQSSGVIINSTSTLKILMMPFSKFHVQKVEKRRRAALQSSTLVELQGPWMYSKKILVWVEYFQPDYIQRKHLQFQNDVEILYIPCVELFEKWFDQYGWLFSWKETTVRVVLHVGSSADQSSIISKIVRGQVMRDVFRLLYEFYSLKRCKAQIMVRSSDTKQMAEFCQKISPLCRFTNQQPIVKEFTAFK